MVETMTSSLGQSELTNPFRIPGSRISLRLYAAGREKTNEERLAGKVSLGVGGHMEPSDGSRMDALYRELDEETIATIDGHPEIFEGRMARQMLHACNTM